ncbi:hypothetical protein LCGC14_1252190 [marine sediment metagenome]|uniref:TRASH domain-containing protein n=1 Tax=marine sediment metagenome TaxID=412755 RepID=A0A0F9LPD5_9ZZZZ
MKGFQPGHRHSEETKCKIGRANSRPCPFLCDYCGQEALTTPAVYAKKRRHFCSTKCYAAYRHEKMPKEEQNAFGKGHSEKERRLRAWCRSTTNHAVRDGIIYRMPCLVCEGTPTEAHHVDYERPLKVRWLCFRHHRQEHHENPELLEEAQVK